MGIQSYRELVAWQRAMDFAEIVYRLTARFPREEVYGLTGQVRKAVVSVPSNIAEGHGRGTAREFYRFLYIASGSLREAETQLLIAHRLHYITEAELSCSLDSAAGMARPLTGLLKSIKRKRNNEEE